MEPPTRRDPPPPPPVEDEEIAVASPQPPSPSPAKTQQTEPPVTAAEPSVADIIAPEQDAEEPHEAALKPQEPVAPKEEPEQQTEEDAQPADALYPAGHDVDSQPDAELQPTQAAEEESAVEKQETTAAVVVEETMETTTATAVEDTTIMEPEPTEALVQETSVAIPEQVAAAEETSASVHEELQRTVLNQVAEKIAADVIAEAVESVETLPEEAAEAEEIVAQESISDAEVQRIVLDEVAEAIAKESIAQALESFEVPTVEVVSSTEEGVKTKDAEEVDAEETAAVADEGPESAVEVQSVETESHAEESKAIETVVAIEEQQEEIAVADEVAIAVSTEAVETTSHSDAAEEESAPVDLAKAEDLEAPETAVPSEEAPAEDQSVEEDLTVEKSSQESLEVEEESVTESFEIQMTTEFSAAAESHVTKVVSSSTEVVMADEQANVAASVTVEESLSVPEPKIEETVVAQHVEHHESTVSVVETKTVKESIAIEAKEIETKTDYELVEVSTVEANVAEKIEETVAEEPETTSVKPDTAGISLMSEVSAITDAVSEELERVHVQISSVSAEETVEETIATETVSTETATEAEAHQSEVAQETVAELVTDARSSEIEKHVEETTVKQEIEVQETNEATIQNQVDAVEDKSSAVVDDADLTVEASEVAHSSEPSDKGSPLKKDNEDASAKSPSATSSGRTFKKAANGVRSLVSRFEVGKAEQSPDKLKYRTVDSFFSHDEERSIRVREERQKLEAQSPDKPKFRTVDSFFSHDEERSIRVREEKLKLEALAEQKRLEALAATERALKEEQARIAERDEQERAESNQSTEEAAPAESKKEVLGTEEVAPEDEIPDEAADGEDDEVADNQLLVDTETNQQEEDTDDNKPSTSPSMGDVASRLRKVKSIVRRFESPRRQESLSTLQIRTVRDYFPSASKRNIHVDDEKRRFELMVEQQRLDALAAAAEANHGEYTRFASPRKDLGPGSPKSEPHTPEKVFSTPTKKPVMPMINDEDKESSSSGEEEDTEAQQETVSSSLKVKNLASRFESPHKDESLDKLAFRTVRTFFSESESPSIRVGAEKEKFNALVKQREFEAEQRLLASPAKFKLDAQVDTPTTESVNEAAESAPENAPSKSSTGTANDSTVTEDQVASGSNVAESAAVLLTESVDQTAELEKAASQSEEATENTIAIVQQTENAEKASTTTTTKTTTTVTIEEVTSTSLESSKLVDNSSSSSGPPTSVSTTSTHQTAEHTQHAAAHAAEGKYVEPQTIISSKHLHKYAVQEIAPEPPVDGPLSPEFQKAALHDDVLKHSQSLRTIELTFLMKLMKRGNPRKLSHSKTWNGVFRSPVQQTP